MITEDYCSDEVSKLLRKMGFNEACRAYYEDGKFCWTWNDGCSRNTDNPKYVSCPTHQMAMKWLRKKHNIIIVIEPHFYDPMEEKVSSYVFSIWCGDNYENHLTNNYPTFEETVDAALKYCLTELVDIKNMEAKELLFKDLSARLPYGVKAQYYGSEEEMLTVDTIEAIYAQPSIEIIIGQYGLEIEDIKPYLRQMSSMTEEEKKEYHDLCFEEEREVLEYGEWVTKVYYHDTIDSIDWLNKKMFDYRDLIEKGLAIEVTEENNPYK